MHNVVAGLSENVKKQLAAVILFGDTKNIQSNATLTGYPKEKSISLCTKDDGVCWGELKVTAGHLAYLTNGDEQKAINFAALKIDEALKARTPK